MEEEEEAEEGEAVVQLQVTLDNSKYTGPSLNFKRSRVRVFKSPEIFGLIDRF